MTSEATLRALIAKWRTFAATTFPFGTADGAERRGILAAERQKARDCADELEAALATSAPHVEQVRYDKPITPEMMRLAVPNWIGLGWMWAEKAASTLNRLLRQPPSAPAKETATPTIEFNLAQAEALVELFGGDDSLMTVTRHDGVLKAWSTEYPDEGSSILGEVNGEQESQGGSDAQNISSTATPTGGAANDVSNHVLGSDGGAPSRQQKMSAATSTVQLNALIAKWRTEAEKDDVKHGSSQGPHERCAAKDLACARP